MFKKIILRFLIIFISFFFLFPLVKAENLEIELSLDKEEIQQGENFTLYINIKQSSLQNNLALEKIHIPGIENFLQIGSSTSTKISIINGKTATLKQITKNLVANKSGIFKIGPIKISFKDQNGQEKKITSNFFNINITKAKNNDNNFIKTSNNNENQNLSTKKSIPKFWLWLLILIFSASFIIFLDKKNNSKNIKQKAILNKKIIKVPSIKDKNFLIKARQTLLESLSKQIEKDLKNYTNQEILKLLKKEKFFKYEIIKEFFQFYDQAQFAKIKINPEKIQKLLQEII